MHIVPTNQRVRVSEMSQVGNARRAVTNLCHAPDLGEEFVAKAALVVTELSRNLVVHGKGGELLARLLREPTGTVLELLALDRGPGMRNVAECMRDGYSTAGTPGNGFGCMRRVAQELQVYSRLGEGTAVWLRLHTEVKAAPPDLTLEVGGISLAMEGEEVCGDGWAFQLRAEGARVFVVDGLGHGHFAHQAAKVALEVFRDSTHKSVPEMLKQMDHALTATRGAAAAVVEIQPDKATLICAGVGNISMRILREESARSLISENGTLGGSARRIREYTYPWSEGSILLMHSDGVSANWSPDRYPGLFHKHPSLIAGVIYRDHRRERDDATLVVVRHRKTA